MKTAVIVNPQAGNGRTAKIWLNVESALKQSIGPFKSIQTTCRGDAKHLTRQELENGTVRIVAVGGDGRTRCSMVLLKMIYLSAAMQL